MNTSIRSFFAPICSRVAFTTLILSSRFGSFASITCKRRSDSIESSRVDLNASIRSGGRSRMNQIVSQMRISCPLSSPVATHILPTDVPSVAKSLFSERTHFFVRAFARADLPALVYPTIPTVFRSLRFRAFRCSDRVRSYTLSRSRILYSCSLRWRFMISVFVSPIPTDPIHQPWRDSSMPMPKILGHMCFRDASSIWSFASGEVACCSNILSIRSTRSHTLILYFFFSKNSSIWNI